MLDHPVGTPGPAEIRRTAEGDANKVWIVPSEITQALGNLGQAVTGLGAATPAKEPPY